MGFGWSSAWRSKFPRKPRTFATCRQRRPSWVISWTRFNVPTMIEGAGAASGLRFGIIRSRFNEDVTKRLLEGALDALRVSGARDESIDVVAVPGAFEIPLVASKLARSRRYDALICLGAVIRGETPHFDYISAQVS